jgi:hypothetical protein
VIYESIYVFQSSEKLSDILEESKKEEVVIRRRKGDMFSIIPKTKRMRSPFDVPGLNKKDHPKGNIRSIT